MAINITQGYTLSANDSTPGVKNFWILNEEPETVIPSSGGPITGFTTVGDDGIWMKFECADGEGDFSTASTAGSGGIEHVTTANYRIGGLSQAKISSLNELMQSQRIAIVAEMRDGTFYYLSKNGMTAGSGTVTSGTGGGGASSIGGTVVFTSQDAEQPIEVTVATTLAAITDV